MLADDSCLMIPDQVAGAPISHSQEETEESDTLESRVESIQQMLADLKVQLHAKFGNIKLGADASTLKNCLTNATTV